MRKPGATALQTAHKPDFVLDDHSSRRRIATPLQQPTRRFRLRLAPISPPGRIGPMRAGRRKRSGRTPCLFGLAPCGVYHAAPIAGRPVRSYRTFSPLPPAAYIARLRGTINRRRYLLCCTGRLCTLKHKSRTLSGTLPCGVRTFLPLAMLAHARQRSSSRLPFKCSSLRVNRRVHRGRENMDV